MCFGVQKRGELILNRVPRREKHVAFRISAPEEGKPALYLR